MRRLVCLLTLMTVADIFQTANASWSGAPTVAQSRSIDRPALIYPDYSAAVIPPNIAPLNFEIREQGDFYLTKISSKQGKPVEVYGKSPQVVIPAKSWAALLQQNKGQELRFEISVRTSQRGWEAFTPIINTIAVEEIDPYVVYRKMHPTHILVNSRIGVYQRNLCSFDESVVLDTEYFKGGCVNCHTFCRNNPDKMTLGVRSATYGTSTLLIEDGQARILDARFGYTAWHPSGRLVVYTVNDMRLLFHTARNEVRETASMDSALVYCFPQRDETKTITQLSDKGRLENWPGWSPDGKFLYFCTAPKLWTDMNESPPKRYYEALYDIVRVSYDVESDKWGEIETVISSHQAKGSALIPRISPDGRWLLFGLSESGYFPAWQPSNDLYIVDLNDAGATGEYKYRKLDINSDRAESWYSWSSNSRWIVFSSKRDNGIFTRCYLSYVDAQGKVHKPIVVPQKDPGFYDYCLYAFNTPELIIGPVRPAGEQLARVVRANVKNPVNIPITTASPKASPQPTAVAQPQVRE